MVKLSFKWQDKCLDQIVNNKQILTHDMMLDIYASVSERFGSGKKYLGDGDRYFNFMERKWQITYYRLEKIKNHIYSKVGEVYRD